MTPESAADRPFVIGGEILIDREAFYSALPAIVAEHVLEFLRKNSVTVKFVSDA
jgi:hypothetical protein